MLGGLVLMPVLLGMPAFAPIAMEPMRPVAMGSLVGHLVYELRRARVGALATAPVSWPAAPDDRP